MARNGERGEFSDLAILAERFGSEERVKKLASKLLDPDVEDGLNYLKQQPWVDASRIGIDGWSFGGFMVTYAMTHSTSFVMGIGGGWMIVLDRPYSKSPFADNDFGALSVEEVLAHIDYRLPPDGPCDCDRSHDPIRASRLKGDPCRPTHDPGCPHHLKYRLPWWPKPEETQP